MVPGVPAREVLLLFLLLDREAGAERLAEVIEEGIDWHYFTWLVQAERAAPVAERRLAGVAPGLVPDTVRAVLQRLATISAFRMSRLERRLDATLRELRRAGIEVILLKGAGLASTVYPTFSSRPMEDLDLLVRAEQGEEAWALVRRVGWRWDRREELDGFYREHQHYPPLEDRDGTELKLELHTALFSAGNPFILPANVLWGMSEPVPARGKGVYVLSPHLQVLHLSIHLAWSHMLRSACWRTCRDLSHLLGTRRVDWDELVALARGSHSATAVYWTLRLGRRLTGLEVPDGVLARLAPRGARVSAGVLERHFLAHITPAPGACPSDWIQRKLWEAGLRPGWSGHGESRPWTRDNLFRAAEAGAQAAGGTAAAGGAAVAGGADARAAPAEARPRSGTRLWGQVARYREWLRYLGVVSGVSARGGPRVAGRRLALASKRGRSAPGSREWAVASR
jgi:hypothetical protein